MFVRQNLMIMRKLTIVACALIASVSTYAQTEKTEKKVEKKEVRKEVKLEEDNGVKTLTITTKTGGVVTNEVYTGADADKKLKEMESAESMENKEISEDVDVTVENGVKTLRIKRNENGKVTEEVYTGEDADKKLKEMEMAPDTKKGERIERRIEIKETHNE